MWSLSESGAVMLPAKGKPSKKAFSNLKQKVLSRLPFWGVKEPHSFF